jgi:hypothetical protein
VKLSTGETVTLKDQWTHRLNRLFESQVFKDGNELRPANLIAGYEAVMAEMIDAIAKADGTTGPFGQGWLDDLPEKDYKTLQKAVDDISMQDQEKGKKNA